MDHVDATAHGSFASRPGGAGKMRPPGMEVPRGPISLRLAAEGAKAYGSSLMMMPGSIR